MEAPRHRPGPGVEPCCLRSDLPEPGITPVRTGGGRPCLSMSAPAQALIQRPHQRNHGDDRQDGPGHVEPGDRRATGPTISGVTPRNLERLALPPSDVDAPVPLATTDSPLSRSTRRMSRPSPRARTWRCRPPRPRIGSSTSPPSAKTRRSRSNPRDRPGIRCGSGHPKHRPPVGSALGLAIPDDLEQCVSICPTTTTASSGSCIEAATVFGRAQSWLTAWAGGPVPYLSSGDPADWFRGYRRDCSGYVSMALGLDGPGLNTSGLAAHSTIISKTDLQPGDLLINTAPNLRGHVVLFERWTDMSMTSYYGYEQSGDGGTHHMVISYPYFSGYPMTPYRFGAISGE